MSLLTVVCTNPLIVLAAKKKSEKIIYVSVIAKLYTFLFLVTRYTKNVKLELLTVKQIFLLV